MVKFCWNNTIYYFENFHFSFVTEEFYEYHIEPNVDESDLASLSCSNFIATRPHLSPDRGFMPRTALISFPGSGSSWIRSGVNELKIKASKSFQDTSWPWIWPEHLRRQEQASRGWRLSLLQQSSSHICLDVLTKNKVCVQCILSKYLDVGAF